MGGAFLLLLAFDGASDSDFNPGIWFLDVRGQVTPSVSFISYFSNIVHIEKII